MFAKAYEEKYNKKITENVKVMRRLFKESLKVKEILSANTEATMIVEEVESNGADFSLRITREVFNENCQNTLNKAIDVIDDVLAKAGLKNEDIDQIEIIGGSVRIPKVYELIEKKTGKNHSTHLDGDYSMAHGLAFLAANQSVSFKAREIFLTEGPSYEVKVHIEDPLTEGEQKYSKKSTLFPKLKSSGSKKMLTLKYQKDIEVTLNVKGLIKNNDYFIRYNVTGVSNAVEEGLALNMTDPKIQLGFMLDKFGIPIMGRAEVHMTEEVVEVVNKTKNNSNNSSNSTNSTNETNTTNDTNSSEENTADSSDETDTKPSDEEAEGNSTEPVYKKYKRVVKRQVGIEFIEESYS